MPLVGPTPPTNTCFLEPTRVHMPNSTSISSAILSQLTIMTTDRQTDRYTDRCTDTDREITIKLGRMRNE